MRAGSFLFALLMTLLFAASRVHAISPRDGDVVSAMPASLTWDAVAGALRYEVYFGASESGVTAATDASSSFFAGSGTGTSLTLTTPFSPGGMWWWRVDAVRADTTVRGAVWRFSGALKFLGFPSPSRSAGASPALVTDGTTLMSILGDENLETAVYDYKVRVYQKQFGQEAWTWRQTISRPAGTGTSASFASAVALKDGTAWISGAADGGNVGRVYEYRLDDVSGLWQWTGRSVQPQTSETGTLFGANLAFDGRFLVVAGPWARAGGPSYAGVVEIFDAVTLARQVRFTEQTPVENGFFGHALALGDGVLAVGGRSRLAASAKVEVWTRGSAAWSRTAVLAQAVSGFGTSLAMDRGSLLVGSPSTTAGVPGKIYHYRPAGGNTWTLASQFAVAGGTRAYSYGVAMAASGGFLAVGNKGGYLSGNGITDNVWLYRDTGAGGWRSTAPALPVTPNMALPGYGATVAVTDRYLFASNGTDSGIGSGFAVFLHNPAANLAPVFSFDPNLFAEAGESYVCRLTAADENEGDTLQLEAITLPAWLGLADEGGGSAVLSGTPPPGSSGEVLVSVRVRDSAGAERRQAWRVRILPAGTIPQITSVAGGPSAQEGDPVTFSVTLGNATGASYQWYRGETPVPGATGASLTLPKATETDNGLYHVRVTRDQAWIDSAPLPLTVEMKADRYGGDWTCYGNGPLHSGGYPATLGKHRFLPAWTVQGLGSQSNAVTSSGRVFISSLANSGGGSLTALNLQTGAQIWKVALPSMKRPGPATVHRGLVYLALAPADGSPEYEMRCHDGASGALRWSTGYSSFWVANSTPVVDDSGVFVSGGRPLGLVGFGLGGARTFETGLTSAFTWMPLLHQGRVYSRTFEFLLGHQAATGVVDTRVLVNTAPRVADDEYATVPAAEDDMVAIATKAGVSAVNLETGEVAWQVSRPVTDVRNPAIRRGVVYGITGGYVSPAGAVEGFNALTGASVATYRTTTAAGGDAVPLHQPLVLDDTLLASDSSLIWTFELGTGRVLQRLTGGGELTYTDGYLLASAWDGTLRAWKVNQPAVITPPPAALAAVEDVPFTWDIPVVDPDADALTITFTGRPAWLSAAPLQAGVVRLTGTPLNQHAGNFSFTISANDGSSFPSTMTITGSVTTVNDRPLAAAITPVTVDEDNAIPPLPLSPVFTDEEDSFGALAIRVAGNSNPALFTGVNLSGSQLVLTPAPDASGSAVITLEATDSGGLSVEASYSVTVNPVADAPRAVTNPPVPTVPPDGAAFTFAAAALFTDPDPGEVLRYAVAGNDHPEIFRSLTVDADTGVLSVEWLPYAWGRAAVTVRATGADGLFLDLPVALELAEPPAPEWRLDGPSSLNRQTGLVEQRITVTNRGERAIAGFELWLSTGDGTVLYNGMSALREGQAAWLLPYFLPLAAGESIALVMEFHQPARRPQFNVAGTNPLNPLAPPHDPPPASTAPFTITSALPVNGSVLIEFPSRPGERYRIEYSSDNQSWAVCPIAITGGGTSVQWLDRGPPFTPSPPSAGGQRFYRVRRL